MIDGKGWEIWEVYVFGYPERFDGRGTCRMGMRRERLYEVVVGELSKLSYRGEGVYIWRTSSDKVCVGCCLKE